MHRQMGQSSKYAQAQRQRLIRIEPPSDVGRAWPSFQEYRVPPRSCPSHQGNKRASIDVRWNGNIS